MTGVPLVILDACVLANFALCDTLLRNRGTASAL